MVKTKLKYVIPTFFTCFAKFSPRAPKEVSCWAGATHGSLLGTEPCTKVGSLQPNTVPFRGHFAHSVVCDSLLPGHLLVRQGEREGDAYGDLCLSCTLHLTALQVAIEAL